MMTILTCFVFVAYSVAVLLVGMKLGASAMINLLGFSKEEAKARMKARENK
ncbi:hypothetical protein [Bacillus cereus]|uniref:hypothetical protein n=1 Tax=Bacillus cereus TaxID=1396 RepID=UPI0013E3D48C|nr:hypothetical protein [Bacillus cereus]